MKNKQNILPQKQKFRLDLLFIINLYMLMVYQFDLIYQNSGP